MSKPKKEFEEDDIVLIRKLRRGGWNITSLMRQFECDKESIERALAGAPKPKLHKILRNEKINPGLDSYGDYLKQAGMIRVYRRLKGKSPD